MVLFFLVLNTGLPHYMYLSHITNCHVINPKMLRSKQLRVVPEDRQLDVKPLLEQNEFSLCVNGNLKASR